VRTRTYDVLDISCGHCAAAISAEVEALPTVERVEVDLEHKRVSVTGRDLDDAAIRTAIYEAGYQAVTHE
jgi:copper chaperone